MTEGSRARPAEIDTIVAALEDRLGSTWAEFQSTPSHFNGVNADDIVRRYDLRRNKTLLLYMSLYIALFIVAGYFPTMPLSRH